MRPKPDDPLLALGLPRAWSYTPVPPRLDTYTATWSIFAIDRRGDCYYSYAALSMVLVELERKGLIAGLHTQTPKSKHLLIKARFRYTSKGTRMIFRVLSERFMDEDE